MDERTNTMGQRANLAKCEKCGEIFDLEICDYCCEFCGAKYSHGGDMKEEDFFDSCAEGVKSLWEKGLIGIKR